MERKLIPYLLQEIGVAPAGSNGQTVEVITIAEAGAQPGDLVRWTDNSVGADGRFAQPEGVVQANGQWQGRLVYNDIPATAVDQSYTGDLQIVKPYFRWVVDQRVLDTVPPAIASVSLVESNPDADPRFTDQEFVATVNMAEEGVPQSTKTIDAHVKGEIKTKVQFKEPLESTSVAQITGDWAGAMSSPDATLLEPGQAFDGNPSSGASSTGSITWNCESFGIVPTKIEWMESGLTRMAIRFSLSMKAADSTLSIATTLRTGCLFQMDVVKN